MGEQTCIVLAGFVVVHIALILCIISIGTPVWIKASSFDNATQSDDNVTTKGLWEICQYGDCERFDQSAQTGSFLATQILFTMGSSLLFLGTVGMYIYLASHVLRMSKLVGALSTLNMFVGAICLLSAVAIFGRTALAETTDLGSGVVLRLGWTYYTAIAATVFCFAAFLAALRRTKILMSRAAGYEDL